MPEAVAYGKVEAIGITVGADNEPIAGSVLEPQGAAQFYLDGSSGYEGQRDRPDWPRVHLLAWYGLREPFDKLLTTSLERGRFRRALDLVQELVPGLDDLRIVIDEDRPVVHLVFEDRSIPVHLGGDGIDSLVRTALELTTAEEGDLVLLEEPEIHQHPAAIRQTARAIVGAVTRGVQIVISTHSLELIDGLLDALDASAMLSVHRTKLAADGSLRTSRHQGEDVVHVRREMELDLR